MPRLLLRLALLPILLALANFGGFAYAQFARGYHESLNPFGTTYQGEGSVVQNYRLYLKDAFSGGLEPLPNTEGTFWQAILRATGASLGLLAVAFVLSTLVGLLLGMAAVQNEKPGSARWLVPIASLGQALPSFYTGTLLIAASVLYVIRQGEGAAYPLPITGFGWDLHLVLPVVALTIRPTMQIAALTAGLLAGEMSKQYITAARSRGNPWRKVRWKHAFRNILAPVILTAAGSFRLLVGELVLVEWLFNWPGLGRLVARALIPPVEASFRGLGEAYPIFLHPPLLAALLTILALLFLLADTLSTALSGLVDPRLNAPEVETIYD